jgi:geranylgeranyl diphosphate synthase type II
MAYQVLLLADHARPQRLLALMRTLNEGVGLPNGIVAGQAWECEIKADLAQYQRAKTGALFVASTCAGAIAAGATEQPWIALGAHLGEAYQVADDIRDVLGQSQDLGKPAGQDVLHARPSAATEFGLSGAVAYFQSLIDSAVTSIPACPCRDMLQQMVLRESERMVPSATCSAYLNSATTMSKTASAQ